MEQENDSGMNEAEYFEYLHTAEAFLTWFKEGRPLAMSCAKRDYIKCVGLPLNSEIKGL